MTKDRFFLWPCCFALGVPAGLDLIETFTSYPSDFGSLFLLFDIVCLFGYLVTSITFLGISLFHMWRGRFRASLACIAMPLLAACLIARPLTSIPSLAPGDHLHFLIYRNTYKAIMDAPHNVKEPQFFWFYWRDASPPVFGEIPVYLVFDESDEISLAVNKRSSAWNFRARDAFVGQQRMRAPAVISNRVRHLFGHYYVVYIDE